MPEVKACLLFTSEKSPDHTLHLNLSLSLLRVFNYQSIVMALSVGVVPL